MAEKEKEPTVHIIHEPVFPSSFSQALSFFKHLATFFASSLRREPINSKTEFAEIPDNYIIVK